MKSLSLTIIFSIAFLCSCKEDVKEKTSAIEKEITVNEPDSIKLTKYFNWKQNVRTYGYQNFDTLAVARIEKAKDTILLADFITKHIELADRYSFWEDWKPKLLRFIYY